MTVSANPARTDGAPRATSAERPHRDLAALGAVTLLALLLRLSRLDLMEFGADDGMTMILGLQVLDGQWPLHGLRASLGFFNPPLFVYLVAAAMALSTSPLFLAGLVATQGAAAVAVAGDLARHLWGRTAGLVAAVAMALSPSALFASRRIFAQDLVPLLAGLILWFAVRCVRDGRRRDVAAIILLTAILTQIHYSGVVLAIVLLVAAVAIRPALSGRAALAGLAGALVLYLPFLAHLVRTDFGDLRAMADSLRAGMARGGDAAAGGAGAFAQAFAIGSDADVRLILANATVPIIERLAGYSAIRALFNGAALLGLVAFFIRSARAADSGQRALGRLLLAWGLIPPLLYACSGLLTIPTYLLILFPLPFVMVGWLAAEVARPGRWRAARRAGLAAVVAVWGLYQMAFHVHSLRWIDTAKATRAPYVPYRDQRAAADFIVARSVPGATRICQNFWSADRGVGFNYLYLLSRSRGLAERSPLYDNRRPDPAIEFRIVEMPTLREFPPPRDADEILADYSTEDLRALRLYWRTADAHSERE